MGPAIIARNYAETLLALATRHGGDAAVDEYAVALDEVGELLRREPRVRQFLETPRIDAEAKKRAVRAAFAGRVPEHLLRFLLVVVEKRRQALLPQIANEYHALVDQLRGRIGAEITLAAQPTAELQSELVASLERKIGKKVVPTFRVDPGLVGGVLIRVGDQILDGSVRRRLAALRRRLLEVRLPETSVVNSTLG
jgi:F-type H+-transporting ATPase subunit delta